MSTQVTWDQCRSKGWTTPRPLLVPEFYGDLCCNPHTQGRQLLYKEPPRRDDKLPVRFGSGTPGVNSTVTDLAGIPKAKPDAVQIANTPEGSLSLPVHFQERAYLPSVETLEILTHIPGTRRLAHPARYYR